MCWIEIDTIYTMDDAEICLVWIFDYHHWKRNNMFKNNLLI
jgi:hypothetical protein